MKIQLDTTKKTIKVEESVKLVKLMNTIKKLLPNNEWKEFTLETNTVIQTWTSPIIIKEYPRPYYPWWNAEPMYYASGKTGGETYSATSTNCSLKSGVFNVEA